MSWTKLMHYKIGVTCVLTGNTFYFYSIVVTRQSYPPISNVNRPCNEFTSAWSMFLCNISIN